MIKIIKEIKIETKIKMTMNNLKLSYVLSYLQLE